MTIYSAPDGSKIDLDPGTVKMFEALALASRRPIPQLASQAVELLRTVLVPEPKQPRKGKGGTA